MWLFLDMNAFFASVEQQERPELRGRPVGVVPMLAETTCCIAASYEAKCCGVKTGTSVVEARQLCPNVEIVAARPRIYRAAHFRIVEAVEQVVPVHQVLSVDEMVVRPWENETSLAEALRLGQQVQDVIRYQVGEWLTCSVGLAPNAFLAKVASDFQKPRGLSVIAFDDIPHKLCHLALTDWPGIGRGMERRFHNYGVKTTAEMYQLTQREMAEVFGGINGERWWRMIRGQAVALPPVKRRQVGHSNVLAPELRTPAGAWSTACRLLEKAAERLRDEGYMTCRLSVSVSSFRGESWSRTLKFLPSDRTYVLLPILKRLWADCPGKPAYVSVALVDIVRKEDVTQPLFDETGTAVLDEVTDSINRRFGRGTLTVASALASKSHLDHGRIPFGKPTALR